ncbi:MAG: hypothetical protein WCO51_11275 [bacterium]|jgi:hypothetical protein
MTYQTKKSTSTTSLTGVLLLVATLVFAILGWALYKGLGPQIKANVATQRVQALEADETALKSRILKLNGDTATAQIETDQKKKALLEQETLLARSQSEQKRVDELCRIAVANRITEENKRIDTSATNLVLRLAISQLEQEVKALSAINSKLQLGQATAEQALANAQKAASEARGNAAKEQETLKSIGLQANSIREDLVSFTGQRDAAKRAHELTLAELRAAQNQLVQCQADIKPLQDAEKQTRQDLAAADAQLKLAAEKLLAAKEAEAQSRIGEASSRQRLEDLRREEASQRRVVEALKVDITALQTTIRAAVKPDASK